MTSGRPGEEPVLALPTLRLVASVIIAPLICGGVWVAAALAGPWGEPAARAGAAGALVVAIVALTGVLVMTPWIRRPVSLWMTLWLAGTVLRLLTTPALAFLLYSATSLGADALALSVATTYLITLLSEAIVLTVYLNRTL